jgi:secondary thiamine-phosphate synthase enzyme
MVSHVKKIKLKTQRQFQLVDITAEVVATLSDTSCKQGQVVVYSPHPTAAIVINHNEPLLQQDIYRALHLIAPIDSNYSHDLYENQKGNIAAKKSHGHAHIKSFILGASENIPVIEGKLALGSEQNVFLVECEGPAEREVIVSIVGTEWHAG